MSKTRRIIELFRSAITGRFITRRRAEHHPETTVHEHRQVHECPDNDDDPQEDQ